MSYKTLPYKPDPTQFKQSNNSCKENRNYIEWEKNPEQQERDLIKNLKRISGLRNDLGHRGMEKFRKEELSSEIAQVVYLMKWCNKFFKKNPGK